jgi:fructokinase
LKGYSHCIETLKTLALKACERLNLKPSSLSAIGLSLPGPVDPLTHTMPLSNSLVFADKDIKKDLKKALKLSKDIFYMENDANCFALAETLLGAGTFYEKETGLPPQKQIALGIILGTGVGGGIILKGSIFSGKEGMAGEFGHMPLHTTSEGLWCYCGSQGCAEQYLSGPGFEASFRKRAPFSLKEISSATDIFTLYEKKEALAVATVYGYKANLAAFLGRLTSLFDPHYFVLGGGLSRQDVLYEELEAQISLQTFYKKKKIRVYKHALSDSAGSLGAALLTLSEPKK